MARITLKEVCATLNEHGWRCADDKYTNLDTPMHFYCPEGHLVEVPWKKMRNKIFCPTCATTLKKRLTNMGGKKKSGEYRVIGLDQSSHKTGYSVFDDGVLISYGVFEASGDQNERMIQLCEWLDSMLAAWQPDEVGIEETQYNPRSNDNDTVRAHDTFKLLSQIMGACLITILRSGTKASTVIIPTWRHHCKVRGNTRTDQKRSAQMLVKQWYDLVVTDDESDAICIGKYFADRHVKAKPQIGEFE